MGFNKPRCFAVTSNTHRKRERASSFCDKRYSKQLKQSIIAKEAIKKNLYGADYRLASDTTQKCLCITAAISTVLTSIPLLLTSTCYICTQQNWASPLQENACNEKRTLSASLPPSEQEHCMACMHAHYVRSVPLTITEAELQGLLGNGREVVLL
jgi:hypothetical protein